MLKNELRTLVDKMVSRLIDLHSDCSLFFLADWQLQNDNDTVAVVHGDDELIERCFRELEHKIRRLESCNMNHSQASTIEIQGIMEDLAEEADPELERLFVLASELLKPGDSEHCSGNAILIVAWRELGISYHRYVDFVGMIRGVVRLFNAGIDSFRKVNQREEGQI